MAAGGPQSYQATVVDRYGNTIGDVSNNTQFSIGPDGSFTATACTAATSGSHTITGDFQEAQYGTTSLQVTPGPAERLAISPSGPAITAGGSQTYTAEDFDTYGNDAGDVTGATSLTIGPDGSCNGLACTPTATGPHRVTGTDGTATATTDRRRSAKPSPSNHCTVGCHRTIVGPNEPPGS
ncbi:MAG: hypothetical protein ACR2MN_09515 [Acidimicrobiales bacterium]